MRRGSTDPAGRAIPTAGEFRLVYDPSVGENARWYVNDHTIFRAGGEWHLIGITHAEPMAPFEEIDLAHATAPALLGPWSKQPHALHAEDAHEETHLWAPHVVAHDDRLWMFYCAGGPSPECYRIHLAMSTDGWAWERHPANPLVVDGYEARDPMVTRMGGRWVMYYTATSSAAGGDHVVVATESDDLVHWYGRHIVYRDPMSGTMAGPTESPFVFERNGTWYLLIGPDWDGLTRSFAARGRYDYAAYRRTRVLAGSDPFTFAPDQQIATLDAHAAELVVDEAGAWWVSHCGWGQGGVHLAPVHWSNPRLLA